MREVFQSTDFTEAGYYQSILDAAGIACFIKNQNTSNPALSGAAFSVSLCVLNDEDFDEAIRTLKAQQASAATAAPPDWICPSCHEKNPGNFEICWNCQTARPS